MSEDITRIGYGALDRVDRESVSGQLSNYFSRFKPEDAIDAVIFTRSGEFELPYCEAYSLYEEITKGTEYPLFSWSYSDRISARNAALDRISAYLMNLYIIGTFNPFRSMGEVADIVSANIDLPEQKNNFVKSFIFASSCLALDYHGIGFRVVKDYHRHDLFYYSALVAIHAMEGLETGDPRGYLPLINKGVTKLSLNDFGKKETRDEWRRELGEIVKTFDGNPSMSATEELAYNVLMGSFRLDSTMPGSQVLGTIRYYEGVELNWLAVQAMYGIYLYLNNSHINKQVVYVNLDEFVVDKVPPLFEGLDTQYVEQGIKNGIMQTLSEIYKDVSGIEFVYTRPKEGSYHTVYVPAKFDDLRNYLGKYPPIKESCPKLEKTLAERYVPVSQTGRDSQLNVLKQRYGVDLNKSICDAYNYPQIISESVVTWNIAEDQFGESEHNMGNRRQAQRSYINSFCTKLGLNFWLTIRKMEEGDYLMASYKYEPKDDFIAYKNKNGIDKTLQAFSVHIGSTIAHEVGHALGLDHTPDFRGKSKLKEDLMDAGYRPIDAPPSAHTLTDYDRAYLNFIMREM